MHPSAACQCSAGCLNDVLTLSAARAEMCCTLLWATLALVPCALACIKLRRSRTCHWGSSCKVSAAGSHNSNTVAAALAVATVLCRVVLAACVCVVHMTKQIHRLMNATSPSSIPHTSRSHGRIVTSIVCSLSSNLSSSTPLQHFMGIGQCR